MTILDAPVAPSWSEIALAARDQALSERTDVRDRVQAFQNALGERVPSTGGFAVPEYLRNDLMLATLEAAIIRPLATVLPMTSLRLGIPSVDDTTHASNALFGGLTWNWTEENTAITATAPAYSRVFLEAKKLAAYLTSVPNELVADAGAFAVFLRKAVALGLAWSEDQAFIAGSGTGQPQGILNAPCAINVNRTTSLQADVSLMVTRMLPQSFKNCIWLCSPDLTTTLLNMYLLVGTVPTSAAVAPSPWLTGTTTDGWTLLGRPVYFTEHVPASGTRGDLILVDPSFYVIGDRKQMSIDASMPGAGYINDETNFRFISRLDGRIWLQSPVTPQNGSATVSPVVVRN